MLDPDALFGELLFPVVSLAVAVILFEGALTLRFSELTEVGSTVTSLVTVGALITWGVSAPSNRMTATPTTKQRIRIQHSQYRPDQNAG